MKPKLIVINGPLGSGKSTLAQKYAEAHPLTLCLDIDDIWRHISHYRANSKESTHTAKKIAVEMARVNIQNGHDVVIAQIYRDVSYLEDLEKAAESCSANFYEILLHLEKDEAIKRFIDRGKAQGYTDGFRPGSSITLGGKEKKLEKMYDEMMAVVSKRPKTIKIVPTLDDVEATYNEILSGIGE